jgi:hypothetical protein
MRKILSNSVIAALAISTACLPAVAGFSPIQNEKEALSILATGQWQFHHNIRIFKPDGTFMSGNGSNGTWKISGGELDVTFLDNGAKHRFFLPIDPKGTHGLDNNGQPEILKKRPKP